MYVYVSYICWIVQLCLLFCNSEAPSGINTTLDGSTYTRWGIGCSYIVRTFSSVGNKTGYIWDQCCHLALVDVAPFVPLYQMLNSWFCSAILRIPRLRAGFLKTWWLKSWTASQHSPTSKLKSFSLEPRFLWCGLRRKIASFEKASFEIHFFIQLRSSAYLSYLSLSKTARLKWGKIFSFWHHVNIPPDNLSHDYSSPTTGPLDR